MPRRSKPHERVKELFGWMQAGPVEMRPHRRRSVFAKLGFGPAFAPTIKSTSPFTKRVQAKRDKRISDRAKREARKRRRILGD